MVASTRYLTILVIALTCSGLAAQFASAQYGAAAVKALTSRNSASRYSVDRLSRQIQNEAVRPTGVRGVNSRQYLNLSLGGSSTPRLAQKPFSSINRGPAVSPYLALSGPRSTATDYYSIVRPQQKQSQINRQQQIQNTRNEQRLNRLAAEGPFSIRGNANTAPTGHAAVYQVFGSFQNLGGYFPAVNARRR